jgi:hypothetical protein
MKYLENFNKYNHPLGKLPLQDQVQNWVQYLDDNYPISLFRNMKTIEVSGKNQYLSGPILVKSRLVDKLFYDIPVEGEINSHTYLIQKSSEYANIGSNNDEIQALLDEITSLQQDNLKLNQQILNMQVSSSNLNT